MNKQKIIHIYRRAYPFWFPLPNSDEWYLAGHSGVIAKNTLKYCDKYNIEIWRMDKNVNKILERNVKGVVCKVFPSYHINGVGDLSIPLIKKLKYEINSNQILIHYSSIHDPSLYLISSFFKNVPIVAQHHGDHSPMLQWKITKDIKYLLAGYVEKITLKKYVDFFWVLNEEEYRFLSNFAGKNKVKVQLGVGVDFDKFKPQNIFEARRKLNLPFDSKILLTVGSLSKRKGIDYALKALPDVIVKYPQLLYIVLGDEKPDGDYFKKLCNELILADNVYFFGRTDEESLVYAYNAADFFILPSLDEGLPTVLAESMACGTPVIATDVGGVSFALTNFKSGILIPPKDEVAISQAIIDAFETQNSFVIDRETGAMHHSWKSIVENIIEKYDELFKLYYK